MNIRLKTSKDVLDNLNELQVKLGFSTKASVARLAVAHSLKIKGDPREKFKSQDSNGFEFQRMTLTGNNDNIIKSMVVQHLGQSLTDDEYFPELFEAHLNRGIQIVASDFKYIGNKEKYLKSILD